MHEARERESGFPRVLGRLRAIVQIVRPPSGSVELDGRELGTKRDGERSVARRLPRMALQGPPSRLAARPTIGVLVAAPIAAERIGSGPGRRDHSTGRSSDRRPRSGTCSLRWSDTNKGAVPRHRGERRHAVTGV
jgi:hypothetical protein